MKAQSVYLDRYGWNVDIIADATCDDAPYVADRLEAMDADPRFVKAARDKGKCSTANMGLTYTSLVTRETLVVIGRAAYAGELLNTSVHEFMHAVMHICEAFGIDVYGEEPCYMLGGLMEESSDMLLGLL